MWLLAAVVAAVVVAPACTPGDGGPGASKPTTVVPSNPAKVAPRWDHVVSFSGSGDQRTAGFDIAAGAIQWRVTASCGAPGSTLRVSVDGESAPLAEPACPGRAFGFSIRTGPAVLDVAASAGWEVVVDQQLDTPVAEPTMAGMAGPGRVAEGTFYGIDQTGSGVAKLYQLPGGPLVLRLDPFQVTANSDLFVWVSEAAAPRTSKEALESPHVQVDRLKATAGAQNYVLPADLTTAQVRSVVIWCEPVRTAYAAATLEGR